MKHQLLVAGIRNWLNSPNVFGKSKNHIKGKWELYEYYVDSADALQHFEEPQIKANNVLFVLSFLENGDLLIAGNPPVGLFHSFADGRWSLARNFLTCIHPADFRKNLEFQFAFEKGNLKLLKKDAMGKIEFFGFFKRIKSNS